MTATRYRRSRWPHTTNPHLLVNSHSAMRFSPVSNGWLMRTFRNRATRDRLRSDRTLEEALAHPGDPATIRYTESARRLLISPAERDTPT